MLLLVVVCGCRWCVVVAGGGVLMLMVVCRRWWWCVVVGRGVLFFVFGVLC